MSAIRSPSPQPQGGGYSPSHRHSSLATGAQPDRTGSSGSYRNPHSRQSLGPPPPASSSASSTSAAGAARQAPTSPSGYRHVSLSGDRLAEARATSPNPGGMDDYLVDLSQRGGSGAGTAASAAQRMTTYGLTPALGGGGGGGQGRMGGNAGGGGGFGLGGGGGGGRPASEYIGSGIRRGQTPEPQDNAAWANDLADYERTLEALTQASLDESFTAELSAIEQWFRVLSESERTATLYSLLQHSTRTQVKFFTSVLATMAQSDPLSAIMSPNPAAAAAMQNSLQQAQMAGLRSPGAGAGGASLNYPGSVQVPAINQFLAPDSANDNNNGGGLGGGAGSQQQNPSSASAQLAAQRVKNRNRISAPGTLLGAGGGLNNGNGDSAGDAARYIGGKLDDVIERGGSPFDEPGAAAAGIGLARASPRPDGRPVTSDFSGFANNISVPLGGSAFPRSPRPDETSFANSQTIGLGLPSPGLDQLISPLLAGANWASAVNTPQIPMFATHGRQPDATALNQALASTTMHLASVQNELANLQLGAGAGGGRPNPISLSDASQFRRTGATGPAIGPGGIRSGNIYNDDGELVGQGQPGGRAQASPMLNAGQWTRSPMVGGNDFGLGLGMGQIGHDHNGSPYTPRHGLDRASSRSDRNRRSPLLRQSPSPGVPPPPAAANAGGGAGAGAGVAGVEDVDERVLKDVSSWLRTLRLHKYTPNFQGSRWQDMVNMNEADLEKKGVAAQGARRKLLKAFANIRDHYGIPHPADFDRDTLFAAVPADAKETTTKDANKDDA